MVELSKHSLLPLLPLTQSDNPQNPHGLQHAWAFLARLLNALPAARVTATAVDALLKVRPPSLVGEGGLGPCCACSALGRALRLSLHHFSCAIPHTSPQVAGYRMHLAYRGQFAKLLQARPL